jgi:threonine/homoserine/homoserine lactone efflux protein
MLGTQELALFAFTVFVINATPGVDMAFTVMATLRGGVKAGLAAAAGICAGCVVHTLAAAFGLAALLAASSLAFDLIKWAGAAYLLWLAWGMARQALRPPAAAAERASVAVPRTMAWALCRQGFVTNVLNPKVALFFLALLPQFIVASAPGKTVAFVFLGAWFIVQGFLFLATLVAVVAALRRLPPSRWAARSLNGAGSLLFAGLAVRLAIAERP